MTNQADVVIIGGGFAGVTAARELVQAGRSVVLLEARDRLGGRTWTKESPLGRPLEIGGTWVHWIQPHVWAEIVRYDLGLVPSPVPERALWLTGGQVKEGTPDELFGLLDPGMQAPLDPAMRYFPNPHQTELDGPDLKDADAFSFRDKIDALKLPADQRDVLDGMWALNFNGHPQNSAWTQGLRWAALAGGSWQMMVEACATYKLAGGTRALLEAIAADATGADIRLETAVRRIAHDASGVTVATESGEVVSAEQAIVTLPLNALSSVEFEPALSPVKAAAAAQGQASTGCKFWARVEGELEPFVAMATSKEPMTFAQLEYHIDGDSLIVGFGPGRVRQARREARLRRQLRQTRRYDPLATTISNRRDEWIAAEILDQLEQIVLTADDQIVGLDLADVSVDGQITKAPCGGEAAGKSPVDRRKLGIKRSRLTDGNGIPLGCVIIGANRNDSPLLRPTLEKTRPVRTRTPRADHRAPRRRHDSKITRDLLDELGCLGQIQPKGEVIAINHTPRRWVVERTNSWYSRRFKFTAICTERRVAVINALLALDDRDHHHPRTHPQGLDHSPLGRPAPPQTMTGRFLPARSLS